MFCIIHNILTQALKWANHFTRWPTYPKRWKLACTYAIVIYMYVMIQTDKTYFETQITKKKKSFCIIHDILTLASKWANHFTRLPTYPKRWKLGTYVCDSDIYVCDETNRQDTFWNTNNKIRKQITQTRHYCIISSITFLRGPPNEQITSRNDFLPIPNVGNGLIRMR